MGQFVALPKLDVSMEDGMITELYVRENDTVTKDQPLFQIESAKAVDDVLSPISGTVIKILHFPDEEIEIGVPVMYIGDTGESMPSVPESIL